VCERERESFVKSGKLCFVFVFSVLKCLCCVMSCDFLSLP